MDGTSDPRAEEARKMREKVGWDESDSRQAEVYANMPPARKIEQMLEVRDEQVRMLKRRLRREHPEMSEAQLTALFLEHLDLLREDYRK